MKTKFHQVIGWVSLLALQVLITRTYAQDVEAFIEPYSRIDVPAAEMGVLSEILVAEGDAVQKGQLLARLDDSLLQKTLLVAKAARDAKGAKLAAEAELELRKNQLNSYRELQAEGNATDREFERALTEFRQAESRVQSVNEELEIRKLEYERVQAQIALRQMHSPIDGFVVALNKNAGEFVSPTDPVVLQVVELKRLRAVFAVPLAASVELKRGQMLKLFATNHPTQIPARIEAVSRVADPESSTVRVKVLIPNEDDKIQCGSVCRWEILRANGSTRKQAQVSESISR
jgi:RND family efflux transporter MFP subunit